MGLIPTFRTVIPEYAEDPSDLDEWIALVSAYMRTRNEIPLIGVTGDDSSVVHHQPPARKTDTACLKYNVLEYILKNPSHDSLTPILCAWL